MSSDNKANGPGNEANIDAENKGYLSLCSVEKGSIFFGEKRLIGNDSIRKWLRSAYFEPLVITVESLIAEDDLLGVVGNITVIDENDKSLQYSYCDVWRFFEGKIVELRGFVIKL